MIDTTELKDKYRPSYILEQVVGLKPVGSQRSTWRRFQYDTGRPSLVCNDDTGTIIDHRGTAIAPGGGNSTDIIGFVQSHYGVGFKSAIEMITGQTVPEEYTPPPPEPPKKPPYTLKQIKQWNLNLLLYGQDILKERNISMEYAKRYMLGYRYKVEKGGVDIDGRSFPLMSGWRLVFPTFRTKPEYDLIRINQRLDTRRAEITYDKFPEKSKELLSELGDKKEVIDTLWRDKYLSLGSPLEPFHGWMIKKWNGAEWRYPRLKSIYVCEGEIDAINLFEETGAVVIPSKKAFVSGAETVFVIADNDDDGDGMDIAEKTAFEFTRIGQPAEIIKPYPEFKDINNMSKAGVLKDWAKEHKIGV